MSVALAIIAKDETERLKNIINLYSDYFDEIAIAIDDNECFEEIKSLGNKKVRLLKYTWCDDFADKRNKLAEFINSEFYFRLDTDDIIANLDNLPDLIKKVLTLRPDVTFLNYIYSRDSDGNCIAKHWRETIIKKSDNFYWNKKIHENIFVVDKSKFNGVKDDTVSILHDVDAGHAEKSLERNFKILVEEYKQDGDETDPRTIAYIGRMLMGLGKWKEAIHFLRMLVMKSGWDDDKYFAYAELGFCHLQIHEYDQAKAACFEAVSINPEYPDAYICLGEVYLSTKEFKKANAWLLHANSKSVPDTVYVIDPSRYSVRLAMNLAMSYLGIGEFEKAKVFYDKARTLAPSNEWINNSASLFTDGFEQDKFIKNLLWMFQYIKEKDSSKIKTLIESIPKNLMCDERVQSLRHQVLPPKKWKEKSVVIYCGGSWEEWADPSVLNGVGGSEEAVIYLSRELVKSGYDVTVFNSCGDLEGTYSGVKYVPYYYFNARDTFDILIAWRGNIFDKVDISARKKYVWKHDVPQHDQYSKERLNKFDKIIVQSSYHRTLFPDFIPDSKFLISRNGVDIDSIVIDDAIIRNPKRMIYTSSYDRGIQHLIHRWDEVKEAVPEAELHLFYGWNVYDEMIKKGFRSKEFKDSMVELMRKDGIHDHGRVSHRRLNEEFQKSGLWVYPCHFEEISCISAMKAQANKCVPVVVDYAALQETVKGGVRVPGKASNKEDMDEFISELISILKDEVRQEEIRSKITGDCFSWAGVAEDWVNDFNGE